MKNIVIKSALAAVIGLASFSSVNAAPKNIPNPKISQITASSSDLMSQEAGKYEIEPTHTTVVWRLTHMGLSNYTARFEKVSGIINFDPKNPTKSDVNIVIDPTSVSTGLPNFNTEIADQAFEAKKFPEIKFVSTSLVKTGDVKGKLSGNLTFHGVTKPVVLDVQFNGGKLHPYIGKQVIGFSARGAIKRSDFGVNNWLPFIGDNVELIIETEAVKK